MYCRNCGRKLRDGAKFCDHCGQSIRESASKNTTTQRRTTSKPASAQTRTRKDFESKQRQRREQEKKQRQKNVRTVVFVFLFAIVASVALGFVSYNMTKKELGKDVKNPEETPINVQSIDDVLDLTDEKEPENTQKPLKTETPEPSEKPEKKEEKPDDSDFEAVAKECNIYRDDRLKDIRCPYPKDFEQGSKSNKNTVLSLIDPLNDGAMMICAETVGSGKSASTLMKDYADGVGADIQTSRAGDDWYEISFERNSKINHRKAVISNGFCVYYDFSYDVDSTQKASYESYMEYIDYYLEKELSSLNKDKKTKE